MSEKNRSFNSRKSKSELTELYHGVFKIKFLLKDDPNNQRNCYERAMISIISHCKFIDLHILTLGFESIIFCVDDI